jgi:hypothetical protein
MEYAIDICLGLGGRLGVVWGPNKDRISELKILFYPKDFGS